MLLLIWANEKYNTHKNLCVFFCDPKKLGVFHKHCKILFGQNFRPKFNILRTRQIFQFSAELGLQFWTIIYHWSPTIAATPVLVQQAKSFSDPSGSLEPVFISGFQVLRLLNFPGIGHFNLSQVSYSSCWPFTNIWSMESWVLLYQQLLYRWKVESSVIPTSVGITEGHTKPGTQPGTL